ncbi:MAG: hypothetical protein QGD94_11085, partial [Planctomycetia bacterium]|nr:hypothetical protein [Planctomycetia bacterium]
AADLQAAASLPEIGIGLAGHATTYRGRYPPNLEALVEMDYITAEILKNPRPREHDPDGGYAYVAGLKRSAAGDFVIAYEKTEGLRNSDGLNVLFVNGLVDWMELEEFHAALDKTMKWLAEHNTSPPED